MEGTELLVKVDNKKPHINQLACHLRKRNIILGVRQEQEMKGIVVETRPSDQSNVSLPAAFILGRIGHGNLCRAMNSEKVRVLLKLLFMFDI